MSENTSFGEEEEDSESSSIIASIRRQQTEERTGSSRPNNLRNWRLLRNCAVLLSRDSSSNNVKKQASGHAGAFRNVNHYLHKSYSDLEFEAFTRLHKDPLGKFAPQFMGVVEIEDQQYLKMQDVLLSMRRPNVMDIKMGVRTFLEKECSSDKRRLDLLEKGKAMLKHFPNLTFTPEQESKGLTKLEYLQLRDTTSSTSSLGFRIDGMLVFDEDGHDCKKIGSTVKEVEHALKIWLKLASHSQCYKLLERLYELRDEIMQSEFFWTSELIGSSLLFVYDTQKSLEKCGIWLIDFGKTTEAPDRLFHDKPWVLGNREDGYLLGLERLIEIFTGVLPEEVQKEFISEYQQSHSTPRNSKNVKIRSRKTSRMT